jgi:hypothetical protein
MSTYCFTPWKIPRIRATLLDSCGVPQTGCSTVVSDGIISVEMEPEYEERQDFSKKNGDGALCVVVTNPPILKWYNVTITMCNVDPDLIAIATAEQRVYDDASPTPNAHGWSNDVGSSANANFALEGWTRLANTSTPCTGGVEYGYGLLPWISEGTIQAQTWQNDTVDLVISGRTNANSPWGLGPYMVDYSDNPVGSTTQVPLLTAIRSTEHRRFFTTRLAPPASVCGCQTLADLTP